MDYNRIRWGHRLNQGMQIIKGRKTIDVIVREIKGSHKYREASLEICGVNGLRGTKISYKDKSIILNRDLKLRISKKSISGGGKVNIEYYFGKGYQLSALSYDDIQARL